MRLLSNFFRKQSILMFAVVFCFSIFGIILSSSPSVSAATIKQVSTGDAHACAIIDNKLKCWGSNGSGQLGNNSTNNSATPTGLYMKAEYTESVKDRCSGFSFGDWCSGSWVYKTVEHAASPLYGESISKVSAGRYHTCAIASASAYCWGKGGSGQLGNNSTSDSSRPVAVSREGVLKNKELIDISAGDTFTCALASDGTVACWGDNSNGQLGNGKRTNSKVPVAVSRTSGSALADRKVKKLAKLSGGVSTMCAITTEDKAVCWGENYAGQVGDGRHADSTNQCFGNGGGTRSVSDVRYKSTNYDSLVPVLATDGAVKSITVSGKSEKHKPVNGWDVGYSYVTTLKNDGRVYWWGGSTSARTCSNGSNTNAQGQNCHQAGGAGQGGCSTPSYERTYTYQGHCLEEKKVLLSSFQCNKRSSAGPISGPLYATAGAGQLQNHSIALISGSAVSGTNLDQYPFCTERIYRSLLMQTTEESCPDPMPADTACAVLSPEGTVYCDDGSQTCNTTGSTIGDNILKAAGKWKCYYNGPQRVSSGGASWLQPGMAIASLDTGFSGYSCAIASINTIGCWGEGDKGQLGNGLSKKSVLPVTVKL